MPEPSILTAAKAAEIFFQLGQHIPAAASIADEICQLVLEGLREGVNEGASRITPGTPEAMEEIFRKLMRGNNNE